MAGGSRVSVASHTAVAGIQQIGPLVAIGRMAFGLFRILAVAGIQHIGPLVAIGGMAFGRLRIPAVTGIQQIGPLVTIGRMAFWRLRKPVVAGIQQQQGIEIGPLQALGKKFHGSGGLQT